MSSNVQNKGAFEPQIIAFCCHYCAYAAADLAGSARIQYSPNVKIIRLPCSGKVDILHILHAFEAGADGVYVAACLEGGCHFMEGNLRAKKRVAYAKQLLEEIGLESERLEMYNMSSAMGGEFAKVADEMTEKISKLGPNPLKFVKFAKQSRKSGKEGS
ncbi:TPA: hydrogenase iron-sulfur subunit [Candidatus Poribacteria bacterium]|nr:hydrogenase iron-sulfur subunit [Candidatus Poribacteria bacterium]